MGSTTQNHSSSRSGSQTPRSRTAVQITSPWKWTLSGKILTVLICILPFITLSVTAPITDASRTAYFIGSSDYQDFEQLCREVFLWGIAVFALVYFIYERLCLKPRREMPLSKMMLTIFGCMGGYLLLGLLSTIFSDYPLEAWIGNYGLYEGYLALLAYRIVFAAAWFWCDRDEVIEFVKKSLVVLAFVLGILAILENTFGVCYYNLSLIQTLSQLTGKVSATDSAVLTFGNADYLGLYYAMLLPVLCGTITMDLKTSTLLIRIAATVLLAMALLLTHVFNAILFGFGTMAVYLLVRLLRSNWMRVGKYIVTIVAVVAVVVGGCGFVNTRSGDTLTEKLEHTIVGVDAENTFRLLEVHVDGNTLTLENADTVLKVTAESESLSASNLTFVCNGTTVTPQESTDGVLFFAEDALEYCQVEITSIGLAFDLGYQLQESDGAKLETIRTSDGWQVVGIGNTILDDVPQVSDSRWLQTKYSYLNGRVFVWANTISELDDCIFLGHGTSTSIYYLEQNDLPALLNIFGQYALFNKPHNWYLQMAQDTGVLSAVLVIVALTVFFFCGIRLFRKKYVWNPWQMGLWFGLLAYAFCGVMNDSMIYHAPMFWFLFGIALRGMAKPKMAENVESEKR